VIIPSASSWEGNEKDATNRLDENVKDGEDTTPMDEGNADEANESAPMSISPNDEDRQAPDGESNGFSNGKVDGTPPQNGKMIRKAKVKFHCPYNINERDTDENTALHISIHSRKIEHVKLLLEAGASIHKKSDGSAPIHTVISLGSLAKHAQFAYDCVVVLHEKGADITAKDDSLHTPLYMACMYNLPQIVHYILSTESGKMTLNTRADRSQGRPLHAAAKFDTLTHIKGIQTPTAGTPAHRILQHHHPDGTVANSLHQIPGFSGMPVAARSESTSSTLLATSSQALVTQILLGTPGIEVDAANSVGQSPLHIACSRGNWAVVRLLLQAGASPDSADRRGFTPGQHAHKRGMPIPNDLLEVLGGPPSSGTIAPPRDLIVDPDSKTLVLTHELCGLHRTCSPIRRDPNSEPPPENVRRLHVLTDEETGILRTGEFSKCTWENETRRAAMLDVLKVRIYKK
jgi:ankyrin repeat protein